MFHDSKDLHFKVLERESKVALRVGHLMYTFIKSVEWLCDVLRKGHGPEKHTSVSRSLRTTQK